MKLMRLVPFAVSIVLMVLFTSCKEDDPEPLQSEVQATLLAGEKGSSKNWKLTGVSLQVGTDPAENFQFDNCFLDNIYTFKNNDTQDYEANEGVSKCDLADPTLIEAGTWTFTTAGEILIILPDVLTGSPAFVFSFLTFPSTVIELTDNTLQLDMSFIDEGEAVKYRLTFVKE